MIDRRTFITSAPPAVAAFSAGSAATTGNPDPHVEWVRRWTELRDEMDSELGVLSLSDPRWAEVYDLEEKAVGTLATTIEGVTAQAKMAAHPSFGLNDETSPDNDCVLIRSMAAALQSLT